MDDKKKANEDAADMSVLEVLEASSAITNMMPGLSVKMRNGALVENFRIMEMLSLTPQKENCGKCKCDNCVQFVMKNCMQSVLKPEASQNSINVSDCPYFDANNTEFLNDLISVADEEYWRYLDEKGILKWRQIV